MSSPDASALNVREIQPAVPLPDPVREVERQMRICNACRYCEGFCAVFPAMTRRLDFDKVDIHYLANLCHNCSACYYACQYAPPHEFAVNVPRAMAQVRQRTYVEFAWPRSLGALYEHNGVAVALATVFGLIGFMALALWLGRSLVGAPDSTFFSVFAHGLMVAI